MYSLCLRRVKLIILVTTEVFRYVILVVKCTVQLLILDCKSVEENNITGEYQAGFKRNYSTVDNMFTLLALVQNQFSLHRKLDVAFIDFKKAFDSL